MKYACFGKSDTDTHHLKSVGNLGRMESRLRCARQREQVMATGFEKDESLLRDSEDWRSKMRLPLKPRKQTGFLNASQPPTQRPWTFSDDFERQQIAQLIKTDSPGVSHMQ